MKVNTAKIKALKPCADRRPFRRIRRYPMWRSETRRTAAQNNETIFEEANEMKGAD